VNLKVKCYAGRKEDERPNRFWLEAKPYVVEAVVDQWYSPESIFFQVRADHGNHYILRPHTTKRDGEWDLVSFRQNKEDMQSVALSRVAMTGSHHWTKECTQAAHKRAENSVDLQILSLSTSM